MQANAIWKFPVPITDYLTLEMPQGAQILALQSQNGLPHIWATVNSEAARETRRFRWFGTGHHIDSTPRSYVGTIQQHGGALVFHLFEEHL